MRGNKRSRCRRAEPQPQYGHRRRPQVDARSRRPNEVETPPLYQPIPIFRGVPLPGLACRRFEAGYVFPIRYRVVSAFGWVCWAGMMVVSPIASLYIYVAYLILIPLMGCFISLRHGSNPCQLVSPFFRGEIMHVVVATDSVNGFQLVCLLWM